MILYPIIFTDLDGTLADHQSYAFTKAGDSVASAQKRGIPICICSSKTRKEIEVYRKGLGIRDSFISENGGAVFVPKGYFESAAFENGEYEILRLGTPYTHLVEQLRHIREELGIRIRAFHEISAAELSAHAGLPIEQARLALEREYDEPFWIEGGEAEVDRIRDCLKESGLQITRGGRYYHLMGKNDKGKAVELLLARFRRKWPQLLSVGLGDSANDIPMLRHVHIAILVKRPDGQYDRGVVASIPNIRLAAGIGPEGWGNAVDQLIREWESVK